MRLRTLCACAVVLLPVAASAQVPAGGEFLVNTYTTGFQDVPRLAPLPDGGFVAVWNNTSLLNAFNVVGRRFDASGVALGTEFQSGAPLAGGAFGLGDVSADAHGNFVVVWQQPGGSADEIYGRLFDAAGNPRGPAFRINGYTPSAQSLPSVAMDRRGNFVVAWDSFGQDGSGYGVFARRFDPLGSPVGGEFVVSNTTVNGQYSPKLAMDATGNFIVAWDSRDPAGQSSVWARRFTAGGSPIGTEFRVPSQANVDATFADLAADPAGNILVSWNQADGSDLGVFARSFDASGTPRTASFQVNTYTTGFQNGASVAMDSSGNSVVTWSSDAQDGSLAGVYAVRLDSSGTRRGAEFRVNTYTSGLQMPTGITADANGNFVIAWYGDLPGSAFNFDSAAQRYGGLRASALRVDTGGNGVWEPGETVDVRPTWRNVNGAALTFSALITSLTGPAGATYTLIDDSASYGTVANNTAAECVDCYAVAVDDPATRPALHWDASAAERITPDALGEYQGWKLHIGRSFSDVPASSPYYRYIEMLLHHGIATGCGGSLYCPANPTTREQMAVFVLLAKEGAGYLPPACTVPMFNDVPASSPYCRYIEELARRGVAGGCGGGNYCPAASVSREQMPVFVLRTLDPTLSPPSCGVPLFADVPASSPFCRWIEELVRRGVVNGCGGNFYCPQSPVTREQMGVFIGGTFGLTLYAP